MANNQGLRVGTYTQKAWTLHKGSFILLKNQPCKVPKVVEFTVNRTGFTKFDFDTHGIFDGTKISHSAQTNADCNVRVPFVNHIHYKIQAISEDGILTLVTEKGVPRNGPNLRLPPTQPGVNDDLLTRTRKKLRERKYLLVEVVSSMETEKLIAVKDVLEDQTLV